MQRIFDGHNDVLLAVHGHGERGPRSFFERSEEGHLDLPRALEGGFAGGFFAAFTPPDPPSRSGRARLQGADSFELAAPVEPGYALRMTMTLAGLLLRLEAESDGRLRVVRDVAELRRCLDGGTLAAVLHVEGAEAIDPQLNALDVLNAAGLRSLGLVWSRPNVFAEGVPFGFPGSPDTGPGLTPAGRELVRACNQLGVMVDLSHLNARGFWDVADLTTAPLVATHSNAHALCPSTRNLTDDQLDCIRDSGGVVGINFSVAFTRPDGEREASTPITELVRHFAYVADRIGADHVAFGSDFDGTTVPDELGDAAGLPRLTEALRSAGFSEAEMRQMALDNWLRVLGATWRAPAG